MTVGLKTRKPLPGKGFRYLMLFLFIVDYRRLFAASKHKDTTTQEISTPINRTAAIKSRMELKKGKFQKY